MANTQAMREEADRLYEILNAYSISSVLLESGLKDFSAASKNELVARLVRTLEPPPHSWLLARLQLILTDENRPDIVKIYLANLRSADAASRKFSLYGLQELGHPDVGQFARDALQDKDDQVLFAACMILLTEAKQDASLRKILRDVYQAHREDASFHMSVSLLEAHGFDRPE